MPPQPNCRQPSLSSPERSPGAAFALGNMKGFVSSCILVWLSCHLFHLSQATSRSLPPFEKSRIHACRPIAFSRRKNTFASDDRSLEVSWWGFPLPAVCDSKLIQLATSGRTSVPVRRRPSTSNVDVTDEVIRIWRDTLDRGKVDSVSPIVSLLFSLAKPSTFQGEVK